MQGAPAIALALLACAEVAHGFAPSSLAMRSGLSSAHNTLRARECAIRAAPSLRRSSTQGASVLQLCMTTVGQTDGTEISIARAQTFLLEGNGFYAAPQPDLFAEDFVFRAPVVGPLCKTDYLQTMGLFKLWEALPDMQANAFGWCLVPPKPDDVPGEVTVRVYVQNTGTHTGPLDVGSLVIPPSGKSYEGTTESIAITLNPDGKVKMLTAGYVVCISAFLHLPCPPRLSLSPCQRCCPHLALPCLAMSMAVLLLCAQVDRLSGNGGGLGAVAGILVAIGLQVPKPYGKVFRFSQWLGNKFGSRFGPRTISKPEDLPSWWTDSRIGSEGL